MENEFGAVSLRNIIRYGEFTIPMYQRNYKWNSKLVKKLTDDIVSCYKLMNKDIKKSVGLLTLYKRDGVYDVIDGQQRLTTLAILLACLGSDININLCYQRDNESNPIRHNAIFEDIAYESTDVNRIIRNKKTIKEVIEQNSLDEDQKKSLIDYILDNVIMLCSVVSNQPVEEFMNLNAYKTKFSVCDYVRANLIALNSFHKEEMEQKEINQILSRCLSNHSYKTAVAVLYNDVQKKLYKEYNISKGTYESIYKLLIDKKLVDTKVLIDPQLESRINIIFRGMLDKDSENYFSEEITENFDYWINILQKLSYVNKLLDELEQELNEGEFHSFKQIDDYQSSTRKSFIREVFEGISALDEEWDSQTLARELQKYSNVDSVLIRCLEQDSKKLANRYLEAFVYSSYNNETNKKADNEKKVKIELPRMTMDDVISEISGCGRYIIDRYEREHRSDLNINISIPPIVDLEDRENVGFGVELDELKNTDKISVGILFKYDIVIPVIQRDYCMGARITGEDDFLAFLLNGFNNNKDNDINASTVLLSVSENNEKTIKTIYIFDGQQRTFTLYNILKYCGVPDLKKYDFVGRNQNEENEYGSPYSKKAVEHLNSILKKKFEEKKIEKKDFADYVMKKVILKAKIVNDISGAEQFFMDINGGVKLNKYEIYKALLCNRLSELKRDDIVRKIENEWLEFFYGFRKEYLKISDIESDESDKEELLEIRFIEHICRFVYRKNHYGLVYEDIWCKDSKNKCQRQPAESYGKKTDEPETEILIFDEIDSKSEVVTKLKYIRRLSDEDICEIDKIMEGIVKNTKTFSDDELVKCDNSDNSDKTSLKLNSRSDKICVLKLWVDSSKKNVLEKQEGYVSRFIWSLDDDNRESIRNYYRYKNISNLKKIYDEDQIMRDIFLINCNSNVVKGEMYPYELCWGDYRINIYGGYRNKSRSFEKKFVKEIPAYYWKGISDCKNRRILREAFIYEKCEDCATKCEDGFKTIYLALVGVNAIAYDDGTRSDVVQIRNEIEIDPEDGGDNYFKLVDDDWQEFTRRSAYVFKVGAYERLKKMKYIINPE